MNVKHPEFHSVTGIANPPQRASFGVAGTVRYTEGDTEYQVIVIAPDHASLRKVRKRILGTDNGWQMAIKAPAVVLDQQDVTLEDDGL